MSSSARAVLLDACSLAEHEQVERMRQPDRRSHFAHDIQPLNRSSTDRRINGVLRLRCQRRPRQPRLAHAARGVGACGIGDFAVRVARRTSVRVHVWMMLPLAVLGNGFPGTATSGLLPTRPAAQVRCGSRTSCCRAAPRLATGSGGHRERDVAATVEQRGTCQQRAISPCHWRSPAVMIG
jgi:hypothetical protein